AVVRLVNAVTQTDVKEQNPDLAGDEW
ncbi:MAG: hypothetical protein ACI81A_001454, partial [Paraglaciecola sp.]